uniref:Uncharacterized protein n=1 Tax=Anguilla anguilla TaxID=7936 RepID=A0A0E9TX20_ANGAN
MQLDVITRAGTVFSEFILKKVDVKMSVIIFEMKDMSVVSGLEFNLPW